MHVGIGVPLQDHVDSWFLRDLVAAVGHHVAAYPDDSVSMIYQQGTLLAEARTLIAKQAIEDGCDFLIFVDTDMRFPVDLIHRMTSHDVEVVAANCAKRRRPISPTARKETEDDPDKLVGIYPDPEVQGLEQIAVVGTAVMCIRSDVFMQIEYPWFQTPWLDATQRFLGEDLFFCANLRAAEIPLYLDHDLSWAIGHVGQYVYRMVDVLTERDLADKGEWSHISPAELIAGAAEFTK